MSDSAPSFHLDELERLTPLVPITVAHGDGIGPEIMEATLRILEAAGARIEIETIEIGEKVYKRGVSAGIDDSSWESLHRTKVFLKAPITTPQGGGFKSLNVTVRKTLGLFANVRPCSAYAPFVHTLHPTMNLVIVRENEEDLYAGIEHRQTNEVVQCLKLVSRTGCERIARYAFEYARANGRKKVTCMTKDNIMKMTDGLFHRVFDEIGAEYPDIQKEHRIIDIGMALAANRPEQFDVIVTTNLYGDIISDVTAEVAGSVGLAPSANIGTQGAMFEAIHGSAPDIAGQNIANPSGLLLAAVMMLVHIGQSQVAERVHNAWLTTLEQGLHTADIYREATSARKLTTTEFATAVIERLGQEPQTLTPVRYLAAHDLSKALQPPKPVAKQTKAMVGIDVFIHADTDPNTLASQLEPCATAALKLQVITNRGVKVWPQGHEETYCTDHWRCRFMAINATITHSDVLELLGNIDRAHFDFVKTEGLFTFDGELGFTLAQGQ